jgi:hypothetical protein
VSEPNRWTKALRATRWLPAYGWQRVARRSGRGRGHVIIALADHFEPSIVREAPEQYASQDEQERRLERWCREYPASVDNWRDADGRPFRHTYFSPAEQYDRALVDRLAEHCRQGWGEVEIHLHHGTSAPDTAAATRAQLTGFRDRLVEHGCLSRLDGTGAPRYAFVHGNWALANSGDGTNCGVDDEMQILAETGCYADFTLPSAPNVSQIGKINSIYECALPLGERAPHRRGRDLRVGRRPERFPIIVQGALMLDFGRVKGMPRIENSEISGQCPPSLRRLRLWRRSAIRVHGRPDWTFIKLHCHGMDPRDESSMFGDAHRTFLRDLAQWSSGGGDAIHFATAREMVNMLLAACDGRSDNPGEYRDYRLQLITP